MMVKSISIRIKKESKGKPYLKFKFIRNLWVGKDIIYEKFKVDIEYFKYDFENKNLP